MVIFILHFNTCSLKSIIQHHLEYHVICYFSFNNMNNFTLLKINCYLLNSAISRGQFAGYGGDTEFELIQMDFFNYLI